MNFLRRLFGQSPKPTPEQALQGPFLMPLVRHSSYYRVETELTKLVGVTAGGGWRVDVAPGLEAHLVQHTGMIAREMSEEAFGGPAGIQAAFDEAVAGLDRFVPRDIHRTKKQRMVAIHQQALAPSYMLRPDILTSLFRGNAPDRLVIATDGHDTLSMTSADSVRGLAEMSLAVRMDGATSEDILVFYRADDAWKPVDSGDEMDFGTLSKMLCSAT